MAWTDVNIAWRRRGATSAAWIKAELMGDAQAKYLRFLCEEFGYSFEPDLTGRIRILVARRALRFSA